MKTFFTKTTLIALALSVAACSATPVRRSMKESWSDSLTASKIRYKMMRDTEVSKSRTHVEVFRGQVTLTGRSTTDAEKARAEMLAKSVKGVTAVDNYVHVVGGSNTAVAKASVKSVQEKTLMAAPGIQEKVIVTEKIKVKVEEDDDAVATLPTIRESTGRPAVVPAAPSVANSRKAVASKAVAVPAKNAKLASVKAAKSQAPIAAARKAPERNSAPAPVISAKPPVPMTIANEAVPVITAPQMAKSATPDQSPVHAPAKVVGQSKTGLPWDGEIYEDDATRISSVAKTSTPAAAKSVTATRAPVSVPTPAPAAVSAPTSGDDLAREAAQELEKLRQKK